MSRPTPRRETQGDGDAGDENELRAVAYHGIFSSSLNYLHNYVRSLLATGA
jgi:hypothetical protein